MNLISSVVNSYRLKPLSKIKLNKGWYRIICSLQAVVGTFLGEKMHDYIIKGNHILLKLVERSKGIDRMAGWYYYIYSLTPFQLVGDCELHPNHYNLEHEYVGNIGYEIKPEYQGLGYAKEAMQLLITLAQDKHINDLVVVARSNNLASNKIIKDNAGELALSQNRNNYYSINLEKRNINDRYQINKR